MQPPTSPLATARPVTANKASGPSPEDVPPSTSASQEPQRTGSTSLEDARHGHLTWNPTTNHIAGLLVGAKVHEALIITSLFDIVYYHVRRALLSSRGVPFGYLTAAFRLNSPFHIFTRQFWAPVSSSWPIGILLVISFPLAFLAGPSSSVLVIPKPGWWPHPDSIGRIWFTQGASVPGLPGLVVPGMGDLTPETTMYPYVIDLNLVPFRCYDSQTTDPSEIQFRGCPYDDLQKPEQGIYSWLWSGSQGFGLTNVTLSTSEGRSALLYDELIGPDDMAVATAPLAKVYQLLSDSASRWALYRGQESVMIKPKVVNKNKESIPLKQPRVLIQCADSPIFPAYGNNDNTEGSYEFRFTTTYYPGFNITIDRARFADALESAASFGFQDLNEELTRVSVSASVALWTRANPRDESLGLCLVDARWVNADIWVNTNAGGPKNRGSYAPLQQSVDITRNETLDYRHQPEAEMVLIAPRWCDLLNTSFVDHTQSSSPRDSDRINYAYNEVSRAASAKLSSIDAKRGYPMFTVDVARAMAVYLADAMSHTPLSGFWQVEWSRDGPWKPDPNYRNLDEGLVPGFAFNVVDDLAAYNLITAEYLVSASAYTFTDIATFVAWGILLAHLVMVLAHFVVVLVFKGWYTRVAGSLGALLALGVESMPSGLGYTHADSGLWKARAYVRDAGPLNGVGIILQDFVDEKGKGKGIDNLG
ncbi:hypothetical protein V8F20_012838 [Naviculisporaceae sp. PSN 640]